MTTLNSITLQTCLEAFPKSAQQLMIKFVNHSSFKASFNTDQVNQLLDCYELSIPAAKAQLCRDLIPLAQTYSLAPISNFHVGAVALGETGNIYLGANMEFSGVTLAQTVHAEQSVITNAWLHKESKIVTLAISAAPCGHCRQFINELNGACDIQVLIVGEEAITFSALLPLSFGPNDLGINDRLLAAPNNALSTEHNDSLSKGPLIKAALNAANTSYSPFTKSPSGLSLQTSTAIYAGCYAENCAYNPSLSPLQGALISLHLAGDDMADINSAVLAESSKNAVSQYETSANVLKIINNISLTLVDVAAD